MNDILKQRLVGALILIALGIVFWPIIFVEPESAISIEDLTIPPRPQVDSTPIAAPENTGLRGSPDSQFEEQLPQALAGDTYTIKEISPDADSGQPEPSAAPAPGQTRSEAPEQPTLDAQGVPVAWMLQVVTVSNADAADELRQRLLAMGHKAWVKPVSVEGKRLYRVNVGPKFERARLDSLRAEIDAEFAVQSLIKRYLP